MFIDEVEIYVKAGKGGDGAVSFRREKFIPKGGPDGGDGGRGGSIIFKADEQLHGLGDLTKRKNYLAENGTPGSSKKKAGRNGEDLVLLVPTGTEIWQKDQMIADMTEPGQIYISAKGGNGGWGNSHFATSIKQAPHWAKEGLRGESAKLKLVLKTIADVGIIGLPNAGKSSLLSVVSKARPKIADYPFTTLEPNLGTFQDRDSRIIFADIPGLIEGASQGKGLGEKFLKHIERTRLLLHLIDASSQSVSKDYETVRHELRKFSVDLTFKPELVALNKSEIVSKADLEQKTKELKSLGVTPIIISAITHQGLDLLIGSIKKSLS